MGITADDVARLGALARIQLTPQECQDLAPELNVILESVRSVSEVAGPDVPMATHAMPLTNVFRDDVRGPSLPREAALANAPKRNPDSFLVPAVLD